MAILTIGLLLNILLVVILIFTYSITLNRFKFLKQL